MERMGIPSKDITQLLRNWEGGDRAAFDDLVELVYDSLQRIARKHLRNERSGHTLSTQALVNEAYLKLVEVHDIQWRSREQFLSLCATVMRNILTQYARAQNREKRWNRKERVSLNDELVKTDAVEELLQLDDALRDLAAFDLRKARIVEMRFFGGLSVQEMARALEVSAITVKREWALAKAWLFNHMEQHRGLHGKSPLGVD